MGTAQPLFQGLYVEGSVDPKRRLSDMPRIRGYYRLLVVPDAQTRPESFAQYCRAELRDEPLESRPFIASHEQVYAYLDNDDAGHKATAELKLVCRNLSDQSIHYRPHNDLNDYLRSRWPVKEYKRLRGRKL